MPNPEANEIVFHFIDFGGLDDLLLNGCWQPPIHHVTGALVFIGCHNKTCIMGTKTGCKHASTPRPPSWLHLFGGTARSADACTILKLILDQKIDTCVHCLFLSWIRDFRDRRDNPLSRFVFLIAWVANATVIAITHCKKASIAPHFPLQI